MNLMVLWESHVALPRHILGIQLYIISGQLPYHDLAN